MLAKRKQKVILRRRKIKKRSRKMVVTKLNISFVIDEEEACEYTLEGTTSNPPYDNIEIMIRRKKKKKNE